MSKNYGDRLNWITDLIMLNEHLKVNRDVQSVLPIKLNRSQREWLMTKLREEILNE